MATFVVKIIRRLAILTIWQDLRDDGDQEIIFIILRALSPRHDGTGTNKQRPGNCQMKGRLWDQENALFGGGGAHTLEGREDRGPIFGGERERKRNEMGWPKF